MYSLHLQPCLLPQGNKVDTQLASDTEKKAPAEPTKQLQGRNRIETESNRLCWLALTTSVEKMLTELWANAECSSHQLREMEKAEG